MPISFSTLFQTIKQPPKYSYRVFTLVGSINKWYNSTGALLIIEIFRTKFFDQYFFLHPNSYQESYKYRNEDYSQRKPVVK